MPEIILTKHVKQRARERGVSLKELDKTVRFPSQIRKDKKHFSQKYIKNFTSYQVVVPIKRVNNKWITTSVWKTYKNFSHRKQFFLEKLIGSFLVNLEKLFSRRGKN